jgi:spore germination cell wall hydrolase CwlJ-like protein
MKPIYWSLWLLVAVCLMTPRSAAASTEPAPDAVDCLALALYWEAKTEGPEGMLAVASVVLNRVAHPQFPSTVCGVVKQGGERPPCQFSWWCERRHDPRRTGCRGGRRGRVARATVATKRPGF